MKKIFVFLSAILICATHAQAFNSQLLHLNFPGGRFLSLVESKPKPMDTLTLGLGASYAFNPLEFANSNGNVRTGDIVSGLATFDFGASYSFSDQAALGINLPMHVTGNIASLTNLAEGTNISLGDVALMGLYNFLDREQTRSGFGVSVMPLVTFPSGSNANFVGDKTLTATVMGIVDGEWKGHYVGLNLGLRVRDTEDLLNLHVGSELLYGLGYSHMLWADENLSGFAEVSGATGLSHLFSEEITTPIETRLGLNKSFLADNELNVTFAGGMGVGSGYGAPDFRAALKVSYDHFLPRAKKEIVVKEVVVEKPVRIQKIEKRLEELTIYYPTDGFQVDPFYDQKIAGIAQVLKDNVDLGPLYIVSHTDDVGKDGYNQKLSERRAEQALNSILQHGIDAKRVVSLGVGETDHIVANDSDQNRALNRRTLFTFEKPKQLREHGEVIKPYWQSPSVSKDGKGSDSYTEVLKQKEQQKPAVVPVLTTPEENHESVAPKVQPKNSDDDASLYDSLENEKTTSPTPSVSPASKNQKNKNKSAFIDE